MGRCLCTTVSMESKRKRRKKAIVFLLDSFRKSLNLFLRETGLHGLKFVGDSQLHNWERSFFFVAFVVALALTCQLIANIYVKWDSTPVIIGISPHATSIRSVPFPAVTICNMNQVLRSKVQHYKEGSAEHEALKLLCATEADNAEEPSDETTVSPAGAINVDQNDIKLSDFVTNHSQPCQQMLRYCRFSAMEYDCAHIFRHIITDEGLCCVFNFMPAEFLYKPYLQHEKARPTKFGHQPVRWDPESGYPAKLPKLYYPTTAVGTGIRMGFTAVLDAQLHEYFCSSTNGPGFKILLHNPITVPNVKEEGLVAGIGYETNFRLAVSRSEAMPTIRGIARSDRQCVFKDEKKLFYHKVYTHGYCENECIAMYLYRTCACIPFNYPHVYRNASVCGVKDSSCIRRAQRPENRAETALCRQECLPSCFDLTYKADAMYFPLAKRDFLMANKLLANISKSYLLENIAVINLYYRESAYYGTMKNVYIGLTEFLSNIGGVMGLFLGFSVISIAEMIYFLVLKPLSELVRWKSSARSGQSQEKKAPTAARNKEKDYVWHTQELQPKGFAAGRSSSNNAKWIAIKDKGKF